MIQSHVYPPYTAGHGYVISADMIGELLRLSKRMWQIRSEDVYVTGVLRKVASVCVRMRCGAGLSSASVKTPNTWDLPAKGITYGVLQTQGNVHAN